MSELLSAAGDAVAPAVAAPDRAHVAVRADDASAAESAGPGGGASAGAGGNASERAVAGGGGGVEGDGASVEAKNGSAAVPAAATVDASHSPDGAPVAEQRADADADAPLALAPADTAAAAAVAAAVAAESEDSSTTGEVCGMRFCLYSLGVNEFVECCAAAAAAGRPLATADLPAGFDEWVNYASLKGEFSFICRYILYESCSQFDSLPRTSLTHSPGPTSRPSKWGAKSSHPRKG
jgi:hypothetical protein